ncbi:MAG: ribonuclease H-like domain-containing protein [Lachnospiraceae bacterium]|nr:ribonuclease H-like domain-containing protein [Lachnospiraceae bacterium]
MRENYAVLEDFELEYPLEQTIPLDEALFIDIETTGFTARSSYLYLIGCAFYSADTWYIQQWFAESYEDETAVLEAFFSFAADYKYLIHFNGNNFDLPFLTQKCVQLGLPYNFDDFVGIDLYRRISPYRYFLKLPNCKQKTIEQFLGVERQDPFYGGELIGVYHDYVKNPTDFSEKALLLHNEDDIKGMLKCLPILAYYDLFNSQVKAKKVQANYYKDLAGNKRQELVMTIGFPLPLPREVSGSANGCYFKGIGTEGQLRIPIYEEELKYYYANYKDYYYLPTEDVALHKSVACYVDKEHRVPATPSTCYTRKFSNYLPMWDTVIEPFFKREHRSKEFFFELTDEIKKDRAAFTKYANHILAMLVASY